MLHVEKKNEPQNLENKKHYVINNNNSSIIFNKRIKERYAAYYNVSTNIKYNQYPGHK
tara:strand:- start:165 stop:338 length:174 start_codon:yes stop_codon:yes gene_type:complete